MSAAIACGLRAGGREAGESPVADGGEGTMEVLVGAFGGELRDVEVRDPLARPVMARFALLADATTAVVECAEASGLGLVSDDERDAMAASTARDGRADSRRGGGGRTRCS